LNLLLQFARYFSDELSFEIIIILTRLKNKWNVFIKIIKNFNELSGICIVIDKEASFP